VVKKTDPARMEVILCVALEVCRVAGILLQPYVPQMAGHVLDQLGIPDDTTCRDFTALVGANMPRARLEASCMKGGEGGEGVVTFQTTTKPRPVFPRLEMRKEEEEEVLVEGSEGVTKGETMLNN
jgi:methionyl-tRNA synthetase